MWPENMLDDLVRIMHTVSSRRANITVHFCQIDYANPSNWTSYWLITHLKTMLIITMLIICFNFWNILQRMRNHQNLFTFGWNKLVFPFVSSDMVYMIEMNRFFIAVRVFQRATHLKTNLYLQTYCRYLDCSNNQLCIKSLVPRQDTVPTIWK